MYCLFMFIHYFLAYNDTIGLLQEYSNDGRQSECGPLQCCIWTPDLICYSIHLFFREVPTFYSVSNL